MGKFSRIYEPQLFIIDRLGHFWLRHIPGFPCTDLRSRLKNNRKIKILKNFVLSKNFGYASLNNTSVTWTHHFANVQLMHEPYASLGQMPHLAKYVTSPERPFGQMRNLINSVISVLKGWHLEIRFFFHCLQSKKVQNWIICFIQNLHLFMVKAKFIFFKTILDIYRKLHNISEYNITLLPSADIFTESSRKNRTLLGSSFLSFISYFCSLLPGWPWNCLI